MLEEGRDCDDQQYSILRSLIRLVANGDQHALKVELNSILQRIMFHQIISTATLNITSVCSRPDFNAGAVVNLI